MFIANRTFVALHISFVFLSFFRLQKPHLFLVDNFHRSKVLGGIGALLYLISVAGL